MTASTSTKQDDPNEFIRRIVHLAQWPAETAEMLIEKGYKSDAVLELFRDAVQGKPQ